MSQHQIEASLSSDERSESESSEGSSWQFPPAIVAVGDGDSSLCRCCSWGSMYCGLEVFSVDAIAWSRLKSAPMWGTTKAKLDQEYMPTSAV